VRAKARAAGRPWGSQSTDWNNTPSVSRISHVTDEDIAALCQAIADARFSRMLRGDYETATDVHRMRVAARWHASGKRLHWSGRW
jgi:hypothetical protein